MTIITKLSNQSILFNLLVLLKIAFYRMTKSIICRSIISYNTAELSYDTIVFKNWQKTIKLLFSYIAYYWTKYKKSFEAFLLIVNKMSINT